jgi:RNA polymerase sigma factor (TIGR02999 family)
MSDVTRILSNIEQGDPEASAALLPLVYDQLRKLAARELNKGATGNTLQPTALVHEAYVRLVDQEKEPQWNHRGHFYAAAAESMRRIVVESARSKQRIKRGGDRERVPFDADQLPAPLQSPDMLALDDALTRLAEKKPQIANLVSLRYFAGLTMGQSAKAMGIPLRTAERNWTYAKAWLHEEIREDK